AGLLGYIIAWIIIPESIESQVSAMNSEEINQVQLKIGNTPQILIGLFLVFIGAVLLIRDCWYLDQIFRDIFRFSWKYLLPGLLIGFGIYIIANSKRSKSENN
ncbi:MAG: hypothetical protein JXR87_09195, partial [Candidatus Marinimicrobia bacterium]|nr:hypothetical protein [Candidatus Neomarinimicrobiota bacterium]